MSGSDGVVGRNIRNGVEELDKKTGYAAVVAVDDSKPYVFVDLGEHDLTDYTYDQDEARVILRLHKDFPNGQHYGMITVPVLTVDGKQPDNTTENHGQASCLRDAGIEEDYLYWSRDWREVPVSEPQHMVRATAFVRGTLGSPFQNQ
jgi:hypothetical protein